MMNFATHWGLKIDFIDIAATAAIAHAAGALLSVDSTVASPDAMLLLGFGALMVAVRLRPR